MILSPRNVGQTWAATGSGESFRTTTYTLPSSYKLTEL